MKELNLSNLLDYKEAVEYFANNKVDNVLSNSGNEHAIVIFDNIYKNAHCFLQSLLLLFCFFSTLFLMNIVLVHLLDNYKN